MISSGRLAEQSRAVLGQDVTSNINAVTRWGWSEIHPQHIAARTTSIISDRRFLCWWLGLICLLLLPFWNQEPSQLHSNPHFTCVELSSSITLRSDVAGFRKLVTE